jgi:spore coat protein A, manganese oxidase
MHRRSFLKLTGGGLGIFIANSANGYTLKSVAALPAPALTANAVPKFATPLLVPPVMPKAGTIKARGGKNIDYYEISLQQFPQQVLPAGFPATTVWGYGPISSEGKRGLMIHNAPSLTIEAQWNRPVRIKWINELVDASGNYLAHLLPIDPTLHWANPGGGPSGRDTRPEFDETPGPYTGPVPMVTHVHGMVGLGDESDGYAEAWFLPNANNIPDGFATEGTWYGFFAAKSAAAGRPWTNGSATAEYPNINRASTLWFHDHTLGMTRANVYAGPAGFYILRGGPDSLALDSRTQKAALLPSPAPGANDKFPSNKRYYEIPLAIQDRSFNADGSLFYPDSREYFDGATAEEPGFIPNTDLSPIWNPEFFGDTLIVNGNTWPFLNVEKRRYRFRILNGCQSRFLILDFGDIPGVTVWQIGNEGGFLQAAVNTTALGNTILLGPAERADVIVDFTNVPVGDYQLRNLGPDEPFGGGMPGLDFEPAAPEGTGQVMQFRVGPALGPDPTTPAQFLLLPPIWPLPAATRTRRLALLEKMSEFWDGPAEALLGSVDDEGMAVHQMWMEPVTENPNVGDTEIWEFYNCTADAHPMHVHEVMFEVIDRQPIAFDEQMGHIANIQPVGNSRPPEAWENGLKDTVIAYPGEVTRIKAKFNTPGQFAWHCHILEHEDNEMMRPYRVGPEQPGQPGTL